MNDDKHAPTDDFVEYLARDTMRKLRHEARFQQTSNVVPSRYRFPKALAVAAGVVFTLSTGMVLGASANYASAAVLPNGTTTIPTRPTFALLPIKNALTAIGCTQPVERARAKVASVAAAATDASAPQTEVTTEPLTLQPEQSAAPAKPDRAMIAMLAKQHQAAVVRGDTLSDYIVMALDAADNYLWSTHGNGNVKIEVGGDTRTLAERNWFNRELVSEFWGKSQPAPTYYSDSAIRPVRISGRIFFSRDSISGIEKPMRITGNIVMDRDSMATGYRLARRQSIQDSTLRLRLTVRDSNAARQQTAGRGGRGGGRGGADIQTSADSSRSFVRRSAITMDSGSVRLYDFGFPEAANAPCGTGIISSLRDRLARAADSTTRQVYASGWTTARSNTRCNEASGLREAVNGESGLIGLSSANVSSADVYTFAAGELAPRQLKVMVVKLTAGTAWSGR